MTEKNAKNVFSVPDISRGLTDDVSVDIVDQILGFSDVEMEQGSSFGEAEDNLLLMSDNPDERSTDSAVSQAMGTGPKTKNVSKQAKRRHLDVESDSDSDCDSDISDDRSDGSRSDSVSDSESSDGADMGDDHSIDEWRFDPLSSVKKNDWKLSQGQDQFVEKYFHDYVGETALKRLLPKSSQGHHMIH